MTEPGQSMEPSNESSVWMCGHCNLPLEVGSVNVAYLGNAFPVELWKCPQCGQVFVPEDLALGKMADVEKQLEDK